MRQACRSGARLDAHKLHQEQSEIDFLAPLNPNLGGQGQGIQILKRAF